MTSVWNLAVKDLHAMSMAGLLAVAVLAGSTSTSSAKPSVRPTAAASARPLAPPAPPTRVDDIEATERSVVRVVTVAMVDGEVVGFGHGSGFAISPNRIVTNAHVVSDAAEYPDNVVIGIVPSEGSRSYPGRLIRIDRRRDLAIVEIVSGRVPPVSIYTGQVAQRETVYALGYPGNVDLATAQNMNEFIRPSSPVATDGIVASFDTIQGVNMLVHDANIARGNSGGPLVDRCGRVLGVNSAISRADDGDSPFSFAINTGELARFLREAGQSFNSVATPCLSAEDAQVRDQALSAEEQRLAAEASSGQRSALAARDAEALQQLRASAQSRSENFMAIAFGLFGIAVLAGAASLLYQSQNKPRERRTAIIISAMLATGAIILFLLRPNPADVHLSRSDPAPSGSQVAVAGTAPAGRYGALTCIADRSRGRITVSAADDSALTITPDGCVNGRTQYVAGAGGIWSRTLVPNQDATVTRISYDPATGQSTTRRYLLPLETMEAVRRQRASVDFQGCTADPAMLATLNRRETAIATLLPAQPNEEIIRDCRATEPAAASITKSTR